MRSTTLRRCLRCAGIASLTLLLAGTGCARGGDAADAKGAPVELGGVTVFETDELLHEVRDVTVDERGRAWVLSGLAPFVRIYSPSGELVRRFGHQGKGPGELLNPWSIFLTGDPAAPVGIWDVGSRRFQAYSADGVPMGSRAVELRPSLVRSDMRNVSYGSVDALRSWGGGFVLQDEPRGVTQPAHILRSQLLKLDLAGAVVDTLVNFNERFRREIRRLGSAQLMVPLPLWTTCPGGELVFLDPFAPALVWHDAAGRPGASTALRVRQRRMVERDRRRYLAHVIELELQGSIVQPGYVEGRAAVVARSIRSWFPPHTPPAVDILCDSHGRVWLQQFSTEEHPLGYGREWIVADRGGVRGRVRFPREFQPRVFTTGRVIGVQTDSLDVQRIAALPL